MGVKYAIYPLDTKFEHGSLGRETSRLSARPIVLNMTDTISLLFVYLLVI